jgi:hypothetical protein
MCLSASGPPDIGNIATAQRNYSKDMVQLYTDMLKAESNLEAKVYIKQADIRYQRKVFKAVAEVLEAPHSP